MRAIVVDAPGDESVLHIGEVDRPSCGPNDLRIAVTHAGVNRADLLQRRGFYPPPPGASRIIGMECAGRVIEHGSAVRGWSVGERAMALLAGGGYAAEVVVDARSALHVPDVLTDAEAGALPEVYLTAFLNIFLIGRAHSGETILVHGGGSGVGTAALNLCRLAGVRVIVTVGSDEKAARCMELGAIDAINYKKESFPERAREITGRGVDLILDSIGASYLGGDLDALAPDGRLVVIGSMGGVMKSELDYGVLLGKRIQITGSTLRSKSAEAKGAIIAAFLEQFGVELRNGNVRPIVDRVLPLAEAPEAHRLMKSSTHFGKIVLEIAESVSANS
jgi:putative PIG3 family NAD(P)H quinone oxidoreductase